MTIIILTISAVACAATLPLFLKQRFPFANRKALKAKPMPVAVTAPPLIENDAGWQIIHSEDPIAFEKWVGKDPNGLPYRPDEQRSLGSHVLIELFDCEEETLRHESDVAGVMLRSAEESKATIVAQSFHEFKPWGVSGAVIIQESHYTIHTWPEHKYAAVDLFYCGGTVAVDQAVEVLRKAFKPQRMKILLVRRGIESEVAGE